jgi:hypothetical protein
MHLRRRALFCSIAPLCRALPFLILWGCLRGFLRGLPGVFEGGQEQRKVVPVHALVAPGKPKKEEAACTIQPGLWLRTVHINTAAVRAVVQPDSTHDNTTKS